MSFWDKLTGLAAVDPGGHRLLGRSRETRDPIFGIPGHSLLLAANGTGKTSRGAMPMLVSLLSGVSTRAILCLDSKDGEMAIQTVPMLAKLGIKVAVIDDMEIWPELADYRVALNAFGSVVQTYQRDKRDAIFALQTMTEALIEEPADDAKNRWFRSVPRDMIAFGAGTQLKRDPLGTTPGATSFILNDPDMFSARLEIEAEEGNGFLRSLAKNLLKMEANGSEHFPQHMDEAQRALRLFMEGTRLHEAGLGATLTHADLIRDGYVIFLVGPQAHMSRLGSYYACHIQSFCSALYQRVGKLAVIADEFTNAPLKSLIGSITTLRAFGGELHLIAQSRSEIIRKFGEQETRTLEDNCITWRDRGGRAPVADLVR